MKKQPDYRLPVFPSVLYSGQDGEPLLCRLIIFDEEMGKLVLYDLTLVAGKVKRDFMVVDSDGTDFVVVEDSVSTGRMLKQRAWEAYHVEVERLEQMPTELIGGPGVPKLTVRDEASWHRDWSYVKQITGPRTRIEKKTAYEFYADAKWRKQVFARLKERLHASVKYISDAFWNSVHFGGLLATRGSRPCQPTRYSPLLSETSTASRKKKAASLAGQGLQPFFGVLNSCSLCCLHLCFLLWGTNKVWKITNFLA